VTADEWKEFGSLWDALVAAPKTTDVEVRLTSDGDYEATVNGIVSWENTPLTALRKAAQANDRVNNRS
jgi:hypothetical protein